MHELHRIRDHMHNNNIDYIDYVNVYVATCFMIRELAIACTSFLLNNCLHGISIGIPYWRAIMVCIVYS